MLTVDHLASLIGKPLDQQLIESVAGVGGSERRSDHDPGHPEANGVVGPSQGSKPREILLRADDYPPASGQSI